ncbi:thioesterase II family protein [Streptomyces sp. NPDC050560]|uniref:thioesterase II family protein n=1 Tax=Streptomyces sp. NPDC050560 TaxID=3365630 RepID=UPI0037A32B8C
MAATGRDDAPWVRRFHPADTPRARVVCFPHAGGSASYFFPVSKALAPSLDVVCLQYPGRQDRRAEPCLDTLDQFADHVTEALAPWRDLPLVFFGHSLGAVIAFETARRLQADGTELAALFASGRRGPATVRDERVHLRPDDALVAELRSLSGTDGAVLGDEEILRMILPAVRSDYRAVETYEFRAGETLRCPLTVLVGDADEKVTLDEARTWEQHTTGPFRMRVFPGGHFYLNHHQAEILDALRESAATATAS